MDSLRPICPDCGEEHPGLIMWTLGRYSCPDPRLCIQALAKRLRATPSPAEGRAKEGDEG